MIAQDLSGQLDRIIAELLARRRPIQAIVTGEDEGALPETFAALEALLDAGYALRVALSHSASRCAISSAFVHWQATHAPGLPLTMQAPQPDQRYSELFFPALSSNSLAKIALGLRDNLASAWAYHALASGKKIVATLNGDFTNTALPAALHQQLNGYVTRLKAYGVAIPHAGQPGKTLVSLAEIRRHPRGATLRLGRHVLLTAAAREEAAKRQIRLIRQE